MSTRFRNYIPRALSAPYAAWFGVAAVLWLSLWNAQTYVCPQDPSTIYLPLARSIADTGFSLESIRSTASWMAPGWPCVLAMSMKVGGPFAPAWIQLPIGCLFLLALWRLLVRLTGNPAAAWLAVWATVLSWVAGPGNTFAFLFGWSILTTISFALMSAFFDLLRRINPLKPTLANKVARARRRRR